MCATVSGRVRAQTREHHHRRRVGHRGMPRHRRVRRSAVRRLSQAEPAVVRLQRPAHPDGHRRAGHVLRASRRTPARGVRLGQHDDQERHLRPDVLLDAAPRQGAPAAGARLDDDQHVHDARGRPRPAARVRLARRAGRAAADEHEHALRRRARLVPQGRGDDGRRRRVRRLRPSPHGGRLHLDVPAHGRAHAGDRAAWARAARKLGAERPRARRRRSGRAARSPGCATTRSSATSSAR